MTQKRKLRFRFILSLLIIGICISVPHIVREHDAMRLGLLAGRIAETDRIVASNSISPVTLTLTGEDAKKIVRAVSSAKASCPGFGRESSCSFGDKATFFKGTNVLDNIEVCGSSFLIHDSSPPYTDESGLLKTLLDHPLAQAIYDAAMKDHETQSK